MPRGRNTRKKSKGRKLSNARKTEYLIVWWINKVPYFSMTKNQEVARKNAEIRNALFVKFGNKVEVYDYYWRKEDSGIPIQAQERNLDKWWE